MFLLDGVVGEVPKDIGRVIAELLAASPQVPLFVPVCLELAAHRCHQGVAADIELPAFVEQRLDVLLHQRTLPESSQFPDGLQDVVASLLHSYAGASVRILSRLDYPYTLVFTDIFREVILVAIDVVCLGNDGVLIDLLQLAILLNVFKETLLIRYLIMIFQVVVHPQLVDYDLFHTLRLRSRHLHLPSGRLYLRITVVL